MSPTSYQAAPPRDSGRKLSLFRLLVKQNPRGDERDDERYRKRLDERDGRVDQWILVVLGELLRVSDLLVDFRLALSARACLFDQVRLILCHEIGGDLVVNELPGGDVENGSHHRDEHPHHKRTPEAYRSAGNMVAV